MKKSVLMLLAITLTCATIHAQQPEKSKQKTEKKTKENNVNECYMMEHGKMHHVMGTKEEPMAGDVTTKNGTHIMMDGTCKMKSGREVKLKEGECCDHNGKISKHIAPKMPK